jgi:hypothetical protein
MRLWYFIDRYLETAMPYLLWTYLRLVLQNARSSLAPGL